ncbi:MAG TPA: tautomerase family protein [Microvirga sp.]|jgi:phenylpyruvate tautomerase PptA (4-oxalocrotonate tautomerase family)
MPFVRTLVRKSMGHATRESVVEGIHKALVDSIGMPDDELFNIVSDYEPTDFHYSRTFNGIARSDELVVVEITLRRGRSDAMKRDLYRQIAKNLLEGSAVSPKDVFIFMHENDYSDWSVGNGEFAMNLAQNRGSDS